VVTVLYIGGLGRSGSTLVERLAGQLPGACAVGEIVHLWQRGVTEDERCGCGTAFAQCPFWQQAGKTAFGGWDEIDTGRVAALRARVDRNRFIPRLAARPAGTALAGTALAGTGPAGTGPAGTGPAGTGPAGTGPAPALAEYMAYYTRLYAAVAEVSGARLVIDSSKHPAHAMLARASAADVTVVHLVRDPRAVAWSHQRAKAPPPGATANTTEQHGPMYVATRWMVRNSFIERRVEPDLRVRYEDMVAETSNTTKAIFAAAGLDVPPDGAGIEHLIAGNPNRFDQGRPKVLAEDVEWREAQPPSHRRITELIAGRGMRRYDYD